MKDIRKIYVITSICLLSFLSVFLIIIYTRSYSYLGDYYGKPSVIYREYVTPVSEKTIIAKEKEIDLTINNTNIPNVNGVHTEELTSSILLVKDTNLDLAEKYYQVSLSIENNTLNFLPGETKILILLKDQFNNTIDFIDGLNYVTENINGTTYSGFDITNISRNQVLIPYSRITADSTNKNPEDIWTAEIIFLDPNGLITDNLNETYKVSLEINEISVSLNELIFSHNGGKENIKKLETNYDSEDIASMYTINDNYGTSYYYKGLVNNNYVKFGGYLWRIVRINGDGSIKLIYVDEDTVELTEDNETSSEYLSNTIGTSLYNNNRYNIEYVGYMYEAGIEDGLTTDSEIKKYLDQWYVNNLISYETYLSDTIFCGNTHAYNSYDSPTNTVGYMYSTYIQFEYRLFDDNFYNGDDYNSQLEPFMECDNKMQAYTVDDVVNGNGALTYPIGLLTAFEYDLSEAYYTGSYLAENTSSFTMTPYYNSTYYRGRGIYMRTIESYTFINTTNNVRPVINLKMDTLATGLGTWYSPYIVS